MRGQRTLYLDAYTRRTSVHQAATRLDTRLILLSVALLLLITAAGLLYLTQASTATELRYRLAACERERAHHEEQIALLRCEIAANQSFAALEERVEELGLMDAPPGDRLVVCYVPVSDVPRDERDAEPSAGATERSGPVGRLLSLLRPEPQPAPAVSSVP